MSQSPEGSVAEPGNRPLRPTMAIGRLALSPRPPSLSHSVPDTVTGAFSGAAVPESNTMVAS
jgi:hypothetical protein